MNRKRKTTLKSKAWTACSRYCRLRDALGHCKGRGIDIGQFVRPEDVIGQCCTCGAVKSWTRMDGGHYISRGLGGRSGVYFDERNINLQCKGCNAWKQGAATEYTKFMLDKYGQEVIDELQLKHHIPLDMRDIAMKAMEIMYKEKYETLVKEL